MWFLPSRNRPQAVADYIAAVRASGCVPPHAVMLDACTGGALEAYDALDWPKNWQVHRSDEHLEVTGAFNALFRFYPDEPVYGQVTDHARPDTPRWAETLERAAGRWGIAFADDRHRRTRNGRRRLGPAVAFGGDLVRAVGWLWLPGTVHFFGDDAWEDIGYGLDLIECRGDVFVRDLAFWAGECPRDGNHRRLFRGRPYHDRDRAAYAAFRETGLVRVCQRVRAAIACDNRH